MTKAQEYQHWMEKNVVVVNGRKYCRPPHKFDSDGNPIAQNSIANQQDKPETAADSEALRRVSEVAAPCACCAALADKIESLRYNVLSGRDYTHGHKRDAYHRVLSAMDRLFGDWKCKQPNHGAGQTSRTN